MIKKRASSKASLESKQSEGRIVGTPDYMAPEMLEGKGLDQPTIDYWALGILFFELIVGIPPFNANSIEQIFEKIKENRIPWEDVVDDEGQEVITPEAKNLIEALLTSDPQKRLGAGSVDKIKSHKFFEGNPR